MDPHPLPDSPIIPPEFSRELAPGVLEILQTYADVLRQKGSVERRTERRRTVCYRLRFRERGANGVNRHRSVSLGHDPEAARLVERVLCHWRGERSEARRLRQEALKERKWLCAERRRLRELVGMAVNGGRRQRRQVRRALDETSATGDPLAGLRVLFDTEQPFSP